MNDHRDVATAGLRKQRADGRIYRAGPVVPKAGMLTPCVPGVQLAECDDCMRFRPSIGINKNTVSMLVLDASTVIRNGEFCRMHA